MTLNLMTWSAAIYWTQVEAGALMVARRCTLA
jgi:hypothetical protein